jgi:hypothetical protein
MRIAPDATIVGVITWVSFASARADGFAVIGIAALLTTDQTLQQLAGSALALPSMLPVFRQLLLDGSKE